MDQTSGQPSVLSILSSTISIDEVNSIPGHDPQPADDITFNIEDCNFLNKDPSYGEPSELPFPLPSTNIEEINGIQGSNTPSDQHEFNIDDFTAPALDVNESTLSLLHSIA